MGFNSGFKGLMLQHFRKTEFMILWCKAPHDRNFCVAMTNFPRLQVTSVLRES